MLHGQTQAKARGEAGTGEGVSSPQTVSATPGAGQFWEGDFIPFSRPSFTPQTLDDVTACLSSGWITTGPRVQAFEKALAQYIGAPHVLTLTSATAGLSLALQALDVGPGDEVITTPLTFAATVNVIALVGATPVLVDVDPETHTLDLDQVERAITPRTKVIMPVHFAGLPVDMDRLNALAQANGIRVVEDAAHAIGTLSRGRQVGSFGDIQVFSFHATKNMTTGEGGALATRDPDIAAKISVLRFHGIDRPAWNRFTKNGSPHYDVVRPAIKFNMMDIQAALGLHQLAQLDQFIEKRTQLVQRYQEFFRTRPYLTCPPQAHAQDRHAWHLFAPCVNEAALGMDRDALLVALKEHNIGASLHYRPVHLFSCYQETYGFREGMFPVAEDVGRRTLSLPLFPDLSFGDQERVMGTLDRLAGYKG